MPPFETRSDHTTTLSSIGWSNKVRHEVTRGHYVRALEKFAIYSDYRTCGACRHLVHRKLLISDLGNKVVCGRCITNVDFLFSKFTMNGCSFTLNGADRLFCYDSACRNLTGCTAQTQEWKAHLNLCEGCRVWASRRALARLEDKYEDDPYFEGCTRFDVHYYKMDVPEYDHDEQGWRAERPNPISLCTARKRS